MSGTTLVTPTTVKKVRIFPLHMTAFEHYMLVDDRPKYPMTFIVEFAFSGDLNQSAFESAFEKAVERHPLFQSIIGPGKQGKECWIAAKGIRPVLRFDDLDQPISLPDSEYIDLRKSIGLRVFVRRNLERAVVTAQFHHSVCDGIGSYQFLGDLLFEYSRLTGDQELREMEPADLSRIKARGRASYDVSHFRLPNGAYERTWDIALKHLRQSHVVIPPPTRKPSNYRSEFPGIQSITFDKDQFKSLRLIAQQRGQILNDLLVEKLFDTLHQWNDRYSKFKIRKHVGICLPLNLRETEDNDIPACNIVAHAFIRRTKSELKDREYFRQKLGQELLEIKHARHKLKFMHMIAGGQHFYPKMLKQSLNWKRCLATAILSNTGDPTRQFRHELPRLNGKLVCGNLILDDISGVPPLRPGTNATISIFTYRRLLKICIRCNPNKFSLEDTQELLDLYGEHLLLS